MNPFTVSWYMPVIIDNHSSREDDDQAHHNNAQAPPASNASSAPISASSTVNPNSNAKSKGSDSTSLRDDAEGMDAKFRRGLPDELYVARLLYRGIMMGSCPRLKELDNLRISDAEREKAGALVKKVEDRKLGLKGPAQAPSQPRR